MQVLSAIEKLYPVNDFIFVQGRTFSNTLSYIPWRKVGERLLCCKLCCKLCFKLCTLKFSSLQFLEPTSMYSLGMPKGALQDVKEWNMCNWKNTTTITDTKAALQQFLPRCHAFVEMQKGPIKEYYGWFYLSDFICLTLFSNTFTMIGYCSMCLFWFIWRTLCYIRYFVFFSHTVMEI